MCVVPFNFNPFCTFQDMTRTGNHYEKWLWGDNTINIQSMNMVLVHSTCALFDISQDQRAQYVYTLISLFFLSANLNYIIVLTQFIFESKVFSFWKCIYFRINLLTVAPSVCWYLWFGKPCWKWSQRFPEKKSVLHVIISNKITFMKYIYFYFYMDNSKVAQSYCLKLIFGKIVRIKAM